MSLSHTILPADDQSTAQSTIIRYAGLRENPDRFADMVGMGLSTFNALYLAVLQKPAFHIVAQRSSQHLTAEDQVLAVCLSLSRNYLQKTISTLLGVNEGYIYFLKYFLKKAIMLTYQELGGNFPAESNAIGSSHSRSFSSSSTSYLHQSGFFSSSGASITSYNHPFVYSYNRKFYLDSKKDMYYTPAETSPNNSHRVRVQEMLRRALSDDLKKRIRFSIDRTTSPYRLYVSDKEDSMNTSANIAIYQRMRDELDLKEKLSHVRKKRNSTTVQEATVMENLNEECAILPPEWKIQKRS